MGDGNPFRSVGLLIVCICIGLVDCLHRKYIYIMYEINVLNLI